MANIEKRGNAYRATVRLKGFPRTTATFDSKTDAQRWATLTERKLIEKRKAGEDEGLAEALKLSLGEALYRYIEEVTPTKKNAGARKSEVSVIRRIQNHHIANKKMADIRGVDVKGLIDSLQNAGLSSNTIRLTLAPLSHCFNIAKREWGLESLNNPVQNVRKPKLPGGRERRLVGNEEQRLLAAAESINPELADIIIVAIETAARKNEILGLRWALIDFDKHTAVLEDTKNGETRIAPLSERAEAALLRHRNRNVDALETRRERRRKKNGDAPESNKPQPDVWSYTPSGMYASYQRAMRQAGIEGLTFHDLRHEATSRLFERGLNPMVIQAITGHKTVQMLKRYTHLQSESLVAAVRGTT